MTGLEWDWRHGPSLTQHVAAAAGACRRGKLTKMMGRREKRGTTPRVAAGNRTASPNSDGVARSLSRGLWGRLGSPSTLIWRPGEDSYRLHGFVGPPQGLALAAGLTFQLLAAAVLPARLSWLNGP